MKTINTPIFAFAGDHESGCNLCDLAQQYLETRTVGPSNHKKERFYEVLVVDDPADQQTLDSVQEALGLNGTSVIRLEEILLENMARRLRVFQEQVLPFASETGRRVVLLRGGSVFSVSACFLQLCSLEGKKSFESLLYSHKRTLQKIGFLPRCFFVSVFRKTEESSFLQKLNHALDTSSTRWIGRPGSVVLIDGALTKTHTRIVFDCVVKGEIEKFLGL